MELVAVCIIVTAILSTGSNVDAGIAHRLPKSPRAQLTPAQQEVAVNKHWCRLADTCVPERRRRQRICARDEARLHTMWFEDNCDVMKYNCDNGVDFNSIFC